MIDYTSLPYAKWLEEAIQALVKINPDSIYFGIIKDNEVVSSYFNFDNVELALIMKELLILSVLDRFEDHLDEMIQEYLSENRETNEYDSEEDEEEEETE